MTGRYRRATVMAVLLVVSEVGSPLADSPLARSVRAGRGCTLDPASADIIGTLLTDSSTELVPGAGEALLAALGEHPEVDALYGDAVIDGVYRRRPAWSPSRLMAHPTDLDHVVVRGRTAASAGDLAARIGAIAATADERIAHLPRVITRASPRSLDRPATAAVQAMASDRGLGRIERHRSDRLRLSPSSPDRISVVIPTAGTPGARGHPLVIDAIAACLATDAPDIEVLLVVGDEFRGDADGLATDPRIRIVHRPSGEWSFSASVNLGILEARNPLTLILNDDTELDSTQPDSTRRPTEWIARMAAHLADPTIGAVGALLLYPDHTCQHVGMITDDAFPLHAHVGKTIRQLADLDADLASDCIAVTAACLLARRSDLLAVGGFGDRLPFGFNDVDLCYKLHRAGLRVVVEPTARLIHHESASRPPVTEPWEWDRFIERWGEVSDPWYHPGHHRPDDPNDRRRNADHLEPTEWFAGVSPRTTAIRSRLHHARLGATDPRRPAH